MNENWFPFQLHSWQPALKKKKKKSNSSENMALRWRPDAIWYTNRDHLMANLSLNFASIANTRYLSNNHCIYFIHKRARICDPCRPSAPQSESIALQIPQCTCPIPHNAPFCNRKVRMCAYSGSWCIVGYSSKVMHCGFVRWKLFLQDNSYRYRV